MKISFTTLGCPEWDLQTIIARAREYGYDGVDFRGLGAEMDIWKLPEFSSQADQTASMHAGRVTAQGPVAELMTDLDLEWAGGEQAAAVWT